MKPLADELEGVISSLQRLNDDVVLSKGYRSVLEGAIAELRAIAERHRAAQRVDLPSFIKK